MKNCGKKIKGRRTTLTKPGITANSIHNITYVNTSYCRSRNLPITHSINNIGIQNNWHFESDNYFLRFCRSCLPPPNQTTIQFFHLTFENDNCTTPNILQHRSRSEVWKTMPKPGRLFGDTYMYIYGLLKFT